MKIAILILACIAMGTGIVAMAYSVVSTYLFNEREKERHKRLFGEREE